MRRKWRRWAAWLLSAALLLTFLPVTAGAEDPTWTRISAGWYHSLGVKSDGTLWTWGTNQFHQLGTPEDYSYFLPHFVMNDVAKAEAGESVSLILKTNGDLWVCGSNDLHQLGVTGVEEAHEPVKLLEGVADIFTNYTHSFALKKDGTLWAWGENSDAQLGTGDAQEREEPVQVLENVKFAAAGAYHSAAIKTDGTLWVWGFNEDGQLGLGDEASAVVAQPTQLMEHVADVALSEAFSAAVTESGDLYTWGDNSEGQLATGDTVSHNTPQKVGENFAAVQTGHHHLVALDREEQVFTSGSNYHGQVGDTTGIDSTSLTLVLNGVQEISSHSDHTVAKSGQGFLIWGSNYYGQFGDGSKMDSFSPMLFTGARRQTPQELSEQPDLSAAGATFAAGIRHNLAVKENGELWAWGGNDSGEVGLGITSSRAEPVKVMDHVRSVAAGGTSSYAVDDQNTLWAWGDNTYGQLGNGTQEPSYLPAKIMEKVALVSAGPRFAVAVTTDGVLWGWGNNEDGQLGTGDTCPVSQPVQIMTGVAQAEAGGGHLMILRGDGSLWVCGNGDYGQLGFGGDSGTGIPLLLSDSGVTLISAGLAHSGAIREGKLWMWGSNTSGEIGDYVQEEDNADAAGVASQESAASSENEGPSQVLYAPQEVLSGVESFSLGWSFTLALRETGECQAWGDSTYGQTGVITKKNTDRRTLERDVVAVGAGGYHTLFQKADGSLWGMGNNNAAQLGFSEETESEEGSVYDTPVKILSGVALSSSSHSFRDRALQGYQWRGFLSIPYYVWIFLAGGVLLIVLLVLVLFYHRRMKKLRAATAIAVEQARQLQQENDKLTASKGTQRRTRKNKDQEGS